MKCNIESILPEAMNPGAQIPPQAMKTDLAPRQSQTAFTLTELLTVLGLVAMLMGLLVPTFASLQGAGNFTKAASDVANLLEEARSYARAHNTHVWIGFYDDAASGKIVISVVASKDGANVANGASLLDPARLVQINKLVKIEHTHLKSAGSTTDSDFPIGSGTGHTFDTRPAVADPLAQVGDTSTPVVLSFQYPLGGTAQYTFNKVLQFNPRGEVELNNLIQPVVEIGLQRANTGPADRNLAAIQCTGIAGNVTVYRR